MPLVRPAEAPPAPFAPEAGGAAGAGGAALTPQQARVLGSLPAGVLHALLRQLQTEKRAKVFQVPTYYPICTSYEY